jgi:hypothetical protein
MHPFLSITKPNSRLDLFTLYRSREEPLLLEVAQGPLSNTGDTKDTLLDVDIHHEMMQMIEQQAAFEREARSRRLTLEVLDLSERMIRHALDMLDDAQSGRRSAVDESLVTETKEKHFANNQRLLRDTSVRPGF